MNHHQKLIENKRALVKKGNKTKGAVLYLMSRDIRAKDNDVMSFAQSLALEQEAKFYVYFGLDENSGKYNEAQLCFLIDALEKLEKVLKKNNIPLYFNKGDLIFKLKKTVNDLKIKNIVLDFSPLKQDKRVLEEICNQFDLNIYLVDAHNIVPCWVSSDKKEYAAYTIRPKINKLVDKYLEEAPYIKKHKFNENSDLSETDWCEVKKGIKYKDNIFYPAGEEVAFKRVDDFINKKLSGYDEYRNDPTKDNQSNLSPYLHFGQISTRVILNQVLRMDLKDSSADQFIEELVVRKELSDNFCYYTDNYVSTSCFPDWAVKTLNEHRSDFREYLYSFEEFENAETHDRLWNAAQLEMKMNGKMHGYMRMYWAKKILEWTLDAQTALNIAIELNDKYSIDGNDPNGYAGIAWSIGGVHDRAWFEREIFGKVRYMSFNGCKKKFDVETYIEKFKKSKQENLL